MAIEGVVQVGKSKAPKEDIDMEKTALGAARILGHLGLSMSKTCLLFTLAFFAIMFFFLYIFTISGGGRAFQ